MNIRNTTVNDSKNARRIRTEFWEESTYRQIDPNYVKRGLLIEIETKMGYASYRIKNNIKSDLGVCA